MPTTLTPKANTDDVLADDAHRLARQPQQQRQMFRPSALISTTSPASAATSVPPPTARPTSALASAGASLMPSPTIATRRPCACHAGDELRLLLRQQLGVDLGDAQRLGHALRRRRAVAGQQGDVGDAQPAQLAEHRRRLGAHRVARADRPQHPAVAGHQQRRLPAGVEPLQQGQRLRRQGDALLLQQPPVADDHGAAGRAAP